MEHPFSQLTDEKLMELYQNGEYMAFEVIFHRHQSKVYAYLHKRVHDKDAIDDLFQNIFIKFHKSKHKYSSKYPLLAWIYTLSRNEFLDYVKKTKQTFVALSDNHGAIETSAEKTSIDLDQEKQLTRDEKQAIGLRYLSDQDFEEISKRLKTSPSNVRKIVSRGLHKLRLKYSGGKL
ncbi:MAG: RNA polymerase sigma factor [Deltaproteobacteria bacterium]|nr:RNA polymerase sigma factor [Deltaproteobacteria bacterium]